jgi:hypothetical protein
MNAPYRWCQTCGHEPSHHRITGRKGADACNAPDCTCPDYVIATPQRKPKPVPAGTMAEVQNQRDDLRLAIGEALAQLNSGKSWAMPEARKTLAAVLERTA